MANTVSKNKSNKTRYASLRKSASEKLTDIFSNVEPTNILNQIKAGDTQLLKYDRVENTVYDPHWITEIEECLYDLGLIVQNPKKITKEVTDVVPVELARKTNAESVIHLATHSQYVKEMKENGDIVPNKILNIGSDDFYQTYENRFIATLIRRLVLFVEKRYQFLEENVNVKKTQVMMIKNKSVIDGKEVEIETKVKVSSDDIVDDEQINLNKTYIKRVENLKRYLLYYYNSPFMRMMKTERNVRNPILMTNIIRKNPLYNHCYRLYRFIEKYDLIGVEYKVNETYDEFDEKKLKEINNSFLMSFLTVGPDETIRKTKRIKQRVYKPHVQSNTDDDIFIYGPYYQGPIEFVRADEDFKKYLDANKYLVPPHLTKREKTYWGEEIETNKATDEEMLEVAKLLHRKAKQYREVEKYFDKVVAERDSEEAVLRAKEILQEESKIHDEFEKARQILINNALNKDPDAPIQGPIQYVDRIFEKDKKEYINYEAEKEDNFTKLLGKEYIPFVERIKKSDISLSNAYKQIRHIALCYGLKSRISKSGDSFRAHNHTYLKIAQVGKSLKIHFALNPDNYKNSPIPVIDDSKHSSYKDIPLLLKVRSELSIKRAIKLIKDLAAFYGFEYKEVVEEKEVLHSENFAINDVKTNEISENNSEKLPINKFSNFAKKEFVPFETRISNADASLVNAYKLIKEEILCYGLKSRISKTADSFRAHNKTYIKIAQVGKSLKIHFALDVKDYLNSPIPVIDDSKHSSYKNIPLLLKVRSELSVRRAIKLIEDLAKKNSFTYKKAIVKQVKETKDNDNDINEKSLTTKDSNVVITRVANAAKITGKFFADTGKTIGKSFSNLLSKIRKSQDDQKHKKDSLDDHKE